MDNQARRIVREVTFASTEERIVFPDVVKQLVAAGVQRYQADLILGTRTYFMPDGEAETVQTEKWYMPSGNFSAEAVAKAVREIQAGEYQYLEFCRRIAAAGCAGYFVSLVGQRALYYGVDGETYVEWFPGAKPAGVEQGRGTMQMLDHIGLRTRHFGRMVEFYERALAPLGIATLARYEESAGLGSGDAPVLWIAQSAEPSSSVHLALSAPSRSAVDAFHAAAIQAGARDNGRPGIRADYSPDYYAAFVIDLDGNNLEAVFHAAA